MAYVDELLGRGEKILYIARQHLFVLISHIAAELTLIALLVATGVVGFEAFRDTELSVGDMQAGTAVLLVCGVISLGVIISGFYDYLRWSSEQYIITDRRVLQIRGVLNKGVVDSSLEKINDVGLSQTWLGRIFDYGTIEILTASDTGVNTLTNIARPLEFKRNMLEAKHFQDRGYGYFEPQDSYEYERPIQNQYDIQRTIQELATLRDRGILSTDEFETKKRELLNRI
jgi:Predicted membrane protein